MVGHPRATHLQAANAIEESDLKYAILRPVWLTNSKSERYQLTSKGDSYIGTETSRASIASFISTLVKKPSLYLYENVGVSEPDTDGDRPKAYR